MKIIISIFHIFKFIIILKIFVKNVYYVIKNEFINEEKRNRNNLNIILIFKNNSQSQTNEHNIMKFHFKKMRKIKLFIIQTLTKFKKITFFKLNVLFKRYFLIYLSNIFINEPVCVIFSNMKNDYIIYKKVKYHIQRLYKT